MRRRHLLALNELFGSSLAAGESHVVGRGARFRMCRFSCKTCRRWPPAVVNDPAARFFPGVARQGISAGSSGFGIATAWAYQGLARFPAAFERRNGAARKNWFPNLKGDFSAAAGEFSIRLKPPRWKISRAGAVPGTPPRERRACHAHVRQAVRRLLPSPKTPPPPSCSRKN